MRKNRLFSNSELSISGYDGQPVPNRFFLQEGEAEMLAVVFPGLRYTCDMPLLYYPTRLLLERGADVLQLHVDYTTTPFQSSPKIEQGAWLAADAQAAAQAGLSQRNYAHLILIGKSIGTLAIAALIATPTGAEAVTVWLTPLLRQPLLVEAALRARGPALMVAGTGDQTYEAAALSRIQAETGAETLIVEGANHSLEIPGDSLRSVAVMQEILTGIAEFLDKHFRIQK